MTIALGSSDACSSTHTHTHINLINFVTSILIDFIII